MKKSYSAITYIIILTLSLLCIYWGNQYITNMESHQGIVYGKEIELDELICAQVISIDAETADTNDTPSTEVNFTARVFGNTGRDNTVIKCKQYINSNRNIAEISIGDKVLLTNFGGSGYVFQDYFRLDKIGVLCIGIALFVFLVGGIKGINSLVSLFLICLSIFFVYIPCIQKGVNIYVSTVVLCIGITAMMLLLVYGVCRKSIIVALSCSCGAIASGVFSLLVDHWMKLTGYYNEDMFMLYDLLGFDINVKGLVFAMITIGALGAIIDVSMSIASPLCELKAANHKIPTEALLKSGFNIGKDFIGTMTNTLVLAYLGSSLVMCLIYSASNYSLLKLLNKEEIIIEFLQSLVGCSCILFTIPFTAIIASLVLENRN